MTLFLQILMVTLDLSVFTGASYLIVRVLSGQGKGTRRRLKAAGWILYALLSILLPNLGRDDVLTMTVLGVYYLAFGWFCYHRSKTGIIYQLIYMVTMYASQVMAFFCTLHLSAFFELEAFSRFFLLTLTKDTFLFLSTMGLVAILDRRYVRDGRGLKLRGMVIVPLFSMVLIFLHIISGEMFFARYGYGMIILFCAMVLVINFYCLYFWYDVAANQELRHKLEMMQSQNEMTHQYYLEMEENYSKSRKIIHDIRNHMCAMEQASKLEQAQEYFSDVHEMLNSLGLKFYSGNRMLNIVLNDKLKGLSEEQAQCRLGGVDLGFLSDMDITTIFANLLDNALEAGGGTPEFWIRIQGEQIQDFIIIKIWNSCMDTGKKKDHEGIGLENVRLALTKYQGEMEAGREGDVFSVTLVFPGQKTDG